MKKNQQHNTAQLAGEASLLFRRARLQLCRWIAPDQLFNADMSQEIDRLTLEIERLKAGQL